MKFECPRSSACEMFEAIIRQIYCNKSRKEESREA